MIEPDDFRDDWYAWLTNQCGHIALGLAVAAVMLPFGWWTPVVAALVYWVVVECWGQGVALWRDSIADTFFVMVGGSVFAAHDAGWPTLLGVFVIAGAWLLFGVWRRL